MPQLLQAGVSIIYTAAVFMIETPACMHARDREIRLVVLEEREMDENNASWHYMRQLPNESINKEENNN